jgi:23S rRNA pseudouridine1911/1915/1917 synthase
LDLALVAALAAQGVVLTRSHLARAFAAGEVRVEGAAQRASRVVTAPLMVELVVPTIEPLRAEPEALPLAILYEDSDLLVIDKAAGMVVHAGPGHRRGTLVNAVLHHLGVGAEALPVLPGNDATRPGIVHRLDKDTSGVMVVAKHARAQEGLAALFRAHSLRREYLGVLVGTPTFSRRRIETLHGRDPQDRRRFSPDVERGRRAITEVAIERVFVDAAIGRFTLATGRTHQIRMHARALGHPILGDLLYGGGQPSARIRALASGLGRHALHAAVLGFVHPIRGSFLNFSSPLPPELVALVAALEG